MVLADTLSWLSNPENNGVIELDERIDGMKTESEDTKKHNITIIIFSPEKQNALRNQMDEDPRLRVKLILEISTRSNITVWLIHSKKCILPEYIEVLN